MNPADKPDPARGWQFVKKLLAQDVERFDHASDDEVERQMTAQNVNPARVPSAEELLAKAQERAAKRTEGAADGARVEALPAPRRLPRWLLPAAAAFCGLAGVVVIELPAIQALKVPSAQDRAADLRRAAFRDCDAKQWQRCWRALDDARLLDPEGDLAPLVVRARARAAAGMGTRPPGGGDSGQP